MLSAILFPNDVAIKSVENNLFESFSALVAKMLMTFTTGRCLRHFCDNFPDCKTAGVSYARKIMTQLTYRSAFATCVLSRSTCPRKKS